ncbi:MAG: hypothetical protein WA655_01580 [Candidatus Korobacteraceae bacterium]
MKSPVWSLAICLCFFAALVVPAQAEIVYTPVNISIPIGGVYNIDLNRDGVTDFVLRSKLLQGYCQFGDEYVWSLAVTPANGSALVGAAGRIGSSFASALHNGVAVDSSQSFFPDFSLMAELYWGPCGTGAMGEWLNLPDRYLGLQVPGADGAVHYGWAKLSTVAYVDHNGHLQTSTILSGFAYETVAGQGIVTGQLSDTL